MLAAGSSNTRKTGRFATERSVHFQSSSSAAPRSGPTRAAFSKVVRVMFRRTLVPGCKPTFSRSTERKEGAETLTKYRPGSRLGTEKNPAPSVNTTRLRAPEPAISTTAPIWGVPEALRTYPEMALNRSPAHAGSDSATITAHEPRWRSFTPTPGESSSQLLYSKG